MAFIKSGVGKGQKNNLADVKVVQDLLNLNIRRLHPMEPLSVDGYFGWKTQIGIARFQRAVMRLNNSEANGHVLPGDPTYNALCTGACQPGFGPVNGQAHDSVPFNSFKRTVDAKAGVTASGNFNLSPNFKFFDMTKTDHTEFLEQNKREALDSKLLETGKILCIRLLEPIKRNFRSLHINSGFRCPVLNRAVKGATHSQHMLFQAADFKVPGVSFYEVFEWIKSQEQKGAFTFGQLILEGKKDQWIHLSLGLGDNFDQPFPPGRHIMRIERPPSLGK